MTDSPKLLLVDEDQELLRLSASGLEAAGFDLVQASSAAEAMAKLREMDEQQLPNLAVLNLSEPDSSGLALAKQLLDEFSLPSIFLSDSDNMALVSQAIDQGAVSCLLKPVSMSTLAPLIRSCVAKADEISSIYSMRKHLSQALSSGIETSVATGILMERFKLTDERAFEALRAYARSERRKLQDVSSEIVAAVETLNQANRFREQHSVEVEAN